MPKMKKTTATDSDFPVLTVNGIEIPPESLRVTADEMKEILGWQEEPEDGAFASSYHHIDQRGKKIRLMKNAGNRPFDHKTAEKIMQDLLNRHWAGPTTLPGETVNGETMIISRNGASLSLQHRGCGLIWAEQRWQGWFNGEQSPERAAHWKQKQFWPDGPPIMESLIVRGVSEDPRVIRTIDNVRARSFSDVLCTSGLFGDLNSKDRDRVSRVMANAVKLLWHRVGADLDAYSGQRTHSEGIDFVERHPKLIDAVKHVVNKDKKSAISNWIGAGTAAGLLYMMGCCETDPDKYHGAPEPNEGLLNWSKWDDACEFWTDLASKSSDFEPLTLAVRPMIGDDGKAGYSGYIFAEGEGSGSAVERVAVIIKAWNVVSIGARLTADSIALSYDIGRADDNSVSWCHLDESPSIGGIDRGEPVEEAQSEDVEPEEPEMMLLDHWRKLKSENGDKLLMFAKEGKEGGWNIWADDAEKAAKALEVCNVKLKRIKKHDDVLNISFDQPKFDEYCSLLRIAGYKLASVKPDADGNTVVTDLLPPKRHPKPIARKEEATSAKTTPNVAPTKVKSGKKQPTPLKGGTEK